MYMIRHIQIVDGPVGGVVFPGGGGGGDNDSIFAKELSR